MRSLLQTKSCCRDRETMRVSAGVFQRRWMLPTLTCDRRSACGGEKAQTSTEVEALHESLADGRKVPVGGGLVPRPHGRFDLRSIWWPREAREADPVLRTTRLPRSRAGPPRGLRHPPPGCARICSATMRYGPVTVRSTIRSRCSGRSSRSRKKWGVIPLAHVAQRCVGAVIAAYPSRAEAPGRGLVTRRLACDISNVIPTLREVRRHGR